MPARSHARFCYNPIAKRLAILHADSPTDHLATPRRGTYFIQIKNGRETNAKKKYVLAFVLMGIFLANSIVFLVSW